MPGGVFKSIDVWVSWCLQRQKPLQPKFFQRRFGGLSARFFTITSIATRYVLNLAINTGRLITYRTAQRVFQQVGMLGWCQEPAGKGILLAGKNSIILKYKPAVRIFL